jgi:hypothetical protein
MAGTDKLAYGELICAADTVLFRYFKRKIRKATC